MALKKKYLGFLKQLFLLLFMLLFVSSFTACDAVDNRPYQLNDALTQAIIDELELGNYYSGDLIHQLTLNFNTFIRVQRATNEDIDLTSYIFYRDSSQSNYIRVCQDGWTTYAYAQNPTMPLHFVDFNYNLSSYFSFKVFNNWSYDTNTGLINGVTTSNIQWWTRPYNQTAINTGTGGNGILGGGVNITSGDSFFYLQHAVVLEIDGDSTTHHLMFGRNDQQTYGTYRFTHSLNLSDYLSGDVVPTPTPTPTGGGGGGSTDLTETNQLINGVKNSIDDINTTLTEVPDLSTTTVSSGEIIGSIGLTISGDPYDNFWLFLTTGLSNALSSSNRIIYFDFLGSTHAINLDDTMPHYPEGLQALMEIICIYAITIFIIKQIHEMTILIQSGNMDKVLEMNEESGIVDLF